MQAGFARLKTRYILLDIILLFVILVVIFAIILVLTKNNPKILSNPFLLHIIQWIFTASFCLAIISKLKKKDIQIKNIIGNTNLRDFPWLMLSVVFYGVMTLKQGVSYLTIFFGHKIAPDFITSLIKSSSSQYDYETDSLALRIMFNMVLFTSIVIVAPLSEEFIFRGVIFHRFATKWGTTVAIVISSMIFGLLHMNIHAIAIGISFLFVTLTYIKTKSLIVPIAYHVMNNAMAMMSIIISQIVPASGAVEINFRTLWTGLLNTTFGLLILFYFLKWPSNSDLLPYPANVEAGSNKTELDQVDKNLDSA